MAMQLSFSNILQFFSAIAPILLTFFLVMLSLFNSDVKGFVYLGGVLIAAFINLIILNTLKVKSDKMIPPSCNLIEFPFNLNEYISPAFNTVIIAFTLAYLYLPMVQIQDSVNYPVIISILAILIIDGGTKYLNGCTNIGGIVLGLIVGVILGLGWFAIFYTTDNSDLLFFNNSSSQGSSNNVQCSNPTKQKFICKVYKNGELIGTQN